MTVTVRTGDCRDVAQATLVALRVSRIQALYWFFRQFGSEPSLGELPDRIECTFLPDTRPKHGPHRAYHHEGGSNWPDRHLVVGWRTPCDAPLPRAGE